LFSTTTDKGRPQRRDVVGRGQGRSVAPPWSAAVPAIVDSVTNKLTSSRPALSPAARKRLVFSWPAVWSSVGRGASGLAVGCSTDATVRAGAVWHYWVGGVVGEAAGSAADGEPVDGLVFGGDLGAGVGLEPGAVVAVGEECFVVGELGFFLRGAP